MCDFASVWDETINSSPGSYWLDRQRPQAVLGAELYKMQYLLFLEKKSNLLKLCQSPI